MGPDIPLTAAFHPLNDRQFIEIRHSYRRKLCRESCVNRIFNSTHRQALIALLSVIALLMLPNLVWWWYGHGWAIWIEALLVPALLLLVFFALLGDIPWLACLLLAPFALLAPMEAYYIAQYHHPTSAEIIATLVATNPREVREYLGPALIPITASLLVALALTLLTAWWSLRSHLHWKGYGRAWVLLIGIATPLAAAGVAFATTHGGLPQRTNGVLKLGATLGGSIESSYPFGVPERIASYRQEWDLMRANTTRLAQFRFHARRTSQIKQRQVYVLVIGESSRRADWQLFGYQRPTNPELSRVTNLVPITHLLTSWPESLNAIPLVVTRKPITDRNTSFKEASILRAMQEAGYETYWISNQQAIGKYDSPVSTFAYEAQHVRWLNHASWTAPGSYDEDLLQPLRDALHDSNHNLFIVLHMMGSHLKYDYRYPASFKHFRPTYSDHDDSVPQGIRMRNSYDNTILYTDHVLAGIIDILKHSGASTALWYESDHGEMLPSPTCSFSGHGLGTYFEYQIPALFWYSDTYASLFPERVANLIANAHVPALSADTFESLIDMAGVDFPGHNETWSLFSKQWHYRPRIVNSIWQSDFDNAVIGKKCPIVIPGDSKTSLAAPDSASTNAHAQQKNLPAH